jgi:hypothetical protein
LNEAFSSESSLKRFVFFSESMLVLISNFFDFLFFLDTDLFLLLLTLYLKKKGLLSFINFISNDFMSLLYTICTFSILKFSIVLII